MLKSPKKKGWELENFIVHWLRNTKIDPKAIRTPGSGAGRFKGDIYTPNLPIVIECKNTAKFSPKFLEQMDANGMNWQEGVLIWHPPRRPMSGSVVMMNLSLFETLLKKYVRNNP